MATLKQKIQSLPETIELVGILITKQVYIDEVRLEPSLKYFPIKTDFKDFGWGHRGSTASLLAWSICRKYFTRPISSQLYSRLRDTLILSLPDYQSFKATLQLQTLFMSISGIDKNEYTMEELVSYGKVDMDVIAAVGHMGSTTLLTGADNGEDSTRLDKSAPSVFVPNKKVSIVKNEQGGYDLANEQE